LKDSSEVLARKYRPKNFDELIGQDTITQTLSLALDSNRLSHAYLFSGLRGSGKTSTARIFSKALTCDNGPTSKPCNTCENCIMANEGRHMDIIEMDAASSRKIDDIRALIEHTQYRPIASKFKIFIIDEVHMLTKEAFNALLKTLEEPPAYVKFILATTDPLKLPATILSRTQHFRFKKISHLNIFNHLRHILQLEDIGYEDDALDILARSGSGSLRDTLTLLDQAIIYSKNFVDVKTVTDMLGLIDPKMIDDIFDAIFNKNHPKLLEFSKMLEDYEAEMVVDEFIAYLKEHLYSEDSRFSTLLLERFFRILSESKSLFAINADGGFVLTLLFFKMMEALKVKEIDQMIESLEAEIQAPVQMPIQNVIPTPQAIVTQIKEEKRLEEKRLEEPVKTVMEPQTEQVQNSEPFQNSNPIQQNSTTAQVTSNPSQQKYEQLITKILDRNVELGNIFKSQVSFVSYENSVLTWESCANDEGKAILRHGYGVIKQFVKEIFGFETKIKSNPCTKSYMPEITQQHPEVHAPQNTQVQQPEPNMQEMQSGSTIQNIQTDVGEMVTSQQNITIQVADTKDENSTSCVTGCQNDISPQNQERDGSTILDEPMVKKATELFEATKITVQSKV
jgi:DNA polymerase-3 subunit gamma/tau